MWVGDSDHGHVWVAQLSGIFFFRETPVTRLTMKIIREDAMNTQAKQMRETDPAEDDDLVHQIIEAIRNVRCGQVQITVQNSGVLKVHKTE